MHFNNRDFLCSTFSYPFLYQPVSKYVFSCMSDLKSQRHGSNSSGFSPPENPTFVDDEDIFSKMESSRISRKYKMGLSCSDAEIDYRRGRSLREGKRM